jgi:hypothetical protein
MTIQEATKRGITRLCLVKNGQPVWSRYSFCDLYLTSDEKGNIYHGPWLKVYDPIGQLVVGNSMWEPINALAIPMPASYDGMSAGKDDDFAEWVAPADIDRFPGMPPMPQVVEMARK